MEQTPGRFLVGVGDSGGWYVEPTSEDVESLSDREPFLRSHELHMLALLPRSRLEKPRFLGLQEFENRDVLAVRLAHPDGRTVILYYDPADTPPLGLRVEWADPDVVVSWSDGTTVQDVPAFRRVVFRQGDEEFRYHYERLEFGEWPDSIFEPPDPRAPSVKPRPARGRKNMIASPFAADLRFFSWDGSGGMAGL